MKRGSLSRGRTRAFAIPMLGVLLLLLSALGFSSHAVAHPNMELIAGMTVDRPVAAPGDAVAFTIDITKIPSRAPTLVIDDALPAGLTLLSSDLPTGCSASGSTWTCGIAGRSSLSLTIHALVEESARGKEISNQAFIATKGSTRTGEDSSDHVGDNGEGEGGDDGGGPGGTDVSVVVNASVLVVASHVSLRLAAMQSVATPGAGLNYRLDVVNDGTGPARVGSLVVLLPSHVTMESVFPAPSATADGRIEWTIDEIPVGSTGFLFNGSFHPVGDVTTVLASASVTFVDSNGKAPGRHDVSLSLAVAVSPPEGPPGGPGPDASLPFVGIALLLGAGAAGLVLAQRALVPHGAAGLRIERLFLLHRSGLVLGHFSPRRLPITDPDIQGAMLTVVQNYLQTAVDPSAGLLQQIRCGDRDILFASGRNTVLAAVIGTGDPNVFFSSAPKFLEDLEGRSGIALANWDGVPDRLEGMDGAFRTFTKGLTSRQAT